MQDAGHSQGVTSRDSEQIASLTTRYRLPRAVAIVASVRHDFYAVTISTGRANFARFPRAKTDIDKMARFSAVR